MNIENIPYVFLKYSVHVSDVGILPVHASQSQINVRILKQHPRKEVLLGGMNQEWSVYNLHTHTHVYSSAQSCSVVSYVILSCTDKPLSKINKGRGREESQNKMTHEGREFAFSTLNSCRLAKGSHISFSTLPPTTNKVVTMPISTQAKIKEKPTPLKEQEAECGRHIHKETSVM